MEKTALRAFVILVCLLLSMKAQAREVLSRAQFVEQVLRQNLDLSLVEVESANIEAQASGIRVPPPEVSISQMDMANGGTARGWQVSQTVPFPTKVSRDYSARQHALHARKDEELAEKQTIAAQANLVYFLVWEAQKQKSILEEKSSLLSSHLKIARAMAQSDTFAKIHLLKAQSEKDQVENDLKTNKQIYQERLSLAAKLLDKNPQTFRFRAEKASMTPVPRFASVEDVPQIRAMKMHLKHSESLEKAAQSEWFPDFKLSYAHMGETLRFPENNQITVGVTLPFAYFWQPDAKSSEGTARRLETEIKLRKEIRNIQEEKVNLEETLKTLLGQIETLEEKILPNAMQRKKLFQNVSPRDLSSLREHLETYLSIPNTKLQILYLKGKYEQAVANLAKYKPAEGTTNE